jgi:hypothetical protein
MATSTICCSQKTIAENFKTHGERFIVSSKVPVLLIFFRRPCVLEVLERVRVYAPNRLFLVADGGRTPQEHAQCLEVRQYVEKAIDWPCQVEHLYADTNLGCRGNIPRGISWVFSKVEKAIILEDDTVPDHSFFTFCEEMLVRYKDDERIMTISGTNFFPDDPCFGPYSYTFSGYAETWGYATWARAWRYYDADMLLWPEAKTAGFLQSGFLSAREQKKWYNTFTAVWSKTGGNDPYDYQWVFACWLRGALSIVPRLNLITNIGDGPLATHSKVMSKPLLHRQTQELAFPLSHPTVVVRNVVLDEAYGRFVFYGDPPRLHQRLRTVAVSCLPMSVRVFLRALKERLQRRSV